MLHNILCNNAYLSKWLRDKGDNCHICKTIENTKHLLFECKNVEHIWRKLGSFLLIDIKWKHIILGFYLEQNDKIESLNLLISFIAYKIYKYKMYCRIESLQETEINVCKSVKNALIQYSSMLRLMKCDKQRTFSNFADTL